MNRVPEIFLGSDHDGKGPILKTGDVNLKSGMWSGSNFPFSEKNQNSICENCSTSPNDATSLWRVQTQLQSCTQFTYLPPPLNLCKYNNCLGVHLWHFFAQNDQRCK